MGQEKVARLPFAFAFGYCINSCIYAMLGTQATFSWPTLYYLFFIRFFLAWLYVCPPRSFFLKHELL